MPQNDTPCFEVCVDSPEGLTACQGIADRIELCTALDLGGLTPGPGLMQLAAASGIETHVLIRPRSGDFSLVGEDLDAALQDIACVRAMGLHGVVIGALSGTDLDQTALARLSEAAGDLTTTLHRAFDLVSDQFAALETAIALGFTRILTSGGAGSAADGIAQLARLNAAADGRIQIMAGAGISSGNVAQITLRTGLRHFHASCTKQHALPGPYSSRGFGTHARRPDKAELRRLHTAINSIGS